VAIDYRTRFPVDDRELSGLVARAFGVPEELRPWSRQLERHALTWVGAFDSGRLAGFVQVAWDGGRHAFLLDTSVDPAAQHRGIGAGLVRTAVRESARAGCEWLHVDFDPDLAAFYLDRCGFCPTDAGLIRLTG
jgi:ribosomal protein S18 acetylase RimI-like enzyme